jgi:hypothetical protein
VDHLGRGEGPGSLARGEEKDKIHYGADDNASGVAGLLEIAEALASRAAAAGSGLGRDILFAAWSGEEIGLLGSNHFTRSYFGSGAPGGLAARVAAYLNLDMVGRLNRRLILQGVGSSHSWPALIERANAPLGLPIATRADSYLPTDATPFYLGGVPILSAFTGAHEDYHTPRDTPEKLDYAGAERISRLIARIAWDLASGENRPDYAAQEKPRAAGQRAGLRAYLGTIPDYARTDVSGVALSGVAKGGPAEQAGVRAGDIVVGLAGKKVENIYDYTFVLETLDIGIPAEIVVRRGERTLRLTVTPDSCQ